MRVRAGIAATSAAALALALSGGVAQAQEEETVWLCKPGQSPNPCAGSLETTIEEPDGGTRVERPEPARDPAVDCFYVYPTVSEQPTRNSDRTVEPQQTAIAQYQAQRFSRHCQVYAPMTASARSRRWPAARRRTSGRRPRSPTPTCSPPGGSTSRGTTAAAGWC